MNTEPTTELRDLAETIQQEIADNADRRIAGEDQANEPAAGPQVTVDGEDLNKLLAEYAVLIEPGDVPLTAEQEARRVELEAILNGAAGDQREQPAQPEHVQVDPLDLAGNLLIEALTAIRNGHGNDRRVAQQIALGHAFAAHSQAMAARMHAEVANQQQQLMLEARQLAAGRQGGPAASLVVPTIHLGNGRG